MARWIPNADRTTESKIGGAAAGARSSFRLKLEMVKEYIREEARERQCPIADVPCPSQSAWAGLASGRRARLPGESQLRMYATPKMHTVINKLGNPREAYFAVAKYLLTPHDDT